MTSTPARTHEEAFAQWADFYRRSYAKRTIASCEYAIGDITQVLKLHERGPYTGKLYAELDAARERVAKARKARDEEQRSQLRSWGVKRA
jgi:exonuclease VII small subunit